MTTPLLSTITLTTSLKRLKNVDSNSTSPKSGNLSIALSSENANNCEEKFANTGPNPVVILRTSEIVEQRLRKKIQKLITQRDHWKSEFDKLSYILRMFPYSQAIKERQRSVDLSEKLKRLANYDTMVPLLVSENERLKAKVEALEKVSEANAHPSF